MKLVFLTLTAFLFTVITKLGPVDHAHKVRDLSSVPKTAKTR